MRSSDVACYFTTMPGDSLTVTNVGRLSPGIPAMISLLLDTHAIVWASIEQISRDAVPDMPDRIIAATAVHLGVPLITRDAKLHRAELKTIW